MSYESKISGRTEHRPICGSLIGAKGTSLEPASASSHLILAILGSDLSLIRLAKKAFESAGWRISVDAGSLTFPVGHNSRNVADE